MLVLGRRGCWYYVDSAGAVRRWCGGCWYEHIDGAGTRT